MRQREFESRGLTPPSHGASPDPHHPGEQSWQVACKDDLTCTPQHARMPSLGGCCRPRCNPQTCRGGAFPAAVMASASQHVLGTCSPKGDCIPTPSRQASRRRSVALDRCDHGLAVCNVSQGKTSVFECVDTQASLERCGSCDNDCSAVSLSTSLASCTMTYASQIQGSDDVTCIAGACHINSCSPEFTLAQNGTECIRTSSGLSLQATKRNQRRQAPPLNAFWAQRVSGARPDADL
jgi:hypothetical protein